MDVTADQLRAARALLRLDQADLAQRAHVSVATIRRMEGAQAGGQVSAVTIDGVRRVLELAGAEFIEGGVRRRGVARADTDALVDAMWALSGRSAERHRGRMLLTEDDLYGENGLPA